MSMQDLVIIPVAVLVIVVALFTSYYLFEKMNNTFSQLPDYDKVSPITNKVNGLYDKLFRYFAYFIISLGIGSLVLAFLIPAHPMFLPVSLVMLIIHVLIAAIFSNVTWVIATMPIFSSIAEKYPLVFSIIKYEPYIVGIFGALLIIVMYSKGNKQLQEV